MSSPHPPSPTGDLLLPAADPDADAPPQGPPASLSRDAWRQLRSRPLVWACLAVIALIGLMATAPGLFTALLTDDDGRCELARSKLGPTGGHPFGYDLQGCDYLAQVVRGSRPSLLAGIAVTAGALLVSVVLGLAAGFYGGWVDSLLSRATEVAFGLPFVLGATVILVAFPRHGLGAMTLVLVALGWSTMTRVMRSQAIAVRDADYVRAARMAGARPARLMLRHVLPNAITPVVVVAMLNVGNVISGEATLDFLGVGLQYPQVSWGLQLNTAQSYFLDHPHLLAFPALFLSATVLSFILLGDAVRDAYDPKLR
ncbi:oligopeptide transport system permease protein [Kitasatospora sp. SolWspMP-SS2h]|uniref:ABC transporter permease n=1 Tax=Kitasatospora sp. SolWspMP-SS2h TaxID=1305729 RepID=UPI000DBA9029|nr:ABC transporter permease [Kitasatospora sp. SolWspMP-SS2h]RAJ36854.1 oligopeptide transport system permease protein [Kitasatospora sp. SolWspMP-SS2h]